MKVKKVKVQIIPKNKFSIYVHVMSWNKTKIEQFKMNTLA